MNSTAAHLVLCGQPAFPGEINLAEPFCGRQLSICRYQHGTTQGVNRTVLTKRNAVTAASVCPPSGTVKPSQVPTLISRTHLTESRSRPATPEIDTTGSTLTLQRRSLSVLYKDSVRTAL
jgi:hypothetical protein